MHSHTGSASQVATTPLSSNRFGRIAASLAMMLALLLTTSQWALSPATAAEAAMLGAEAPTGLVQHNDTNGVEVGTRFTARVNGKATGMRFWKDKDTTSTHTGTLWTAQGKKLAAATFATESASGWQIASFDRTVALTAGQTYVVSYYAPKGRYAVTYDVRAKSSSPDLTISSGFGVYKYGSQSRFPTNTYRNSSYWVDLVFSSQTTPVAKPAPTPTPAPAPTTTPAPAPTTTPAPTPTTAPAPTPTTAPAPAPAPAPTATPSTGFPSAATTGVPAGTTLSTYTGPCRITTPNTVIDAKRVNCGPLDIQATGVVITRSIINGTVSTNDSGTGSFTISDSEIVMGAEMGTGIGDARFTALRVEVTGGNRSVNCYLDCSITASYVHGQFRDASGVAHESGIRMGSGSVIRGNTIACDAPDVAPDAGCSAALTGYGDFAVVKNNTIDGNLFVGGSGGYCTYGGATPGKPFSTGTRDIRFTNNVWQRGGSGKCGFYGPITSFDSNAPGAVWSNNRWDDGALVAAAN